MSIPFGSVPCPACKKGITSWGETCQDCENGWLTPERQEMLKRREARRKAEGGMGPPGPSSMLGDRQQRVLDVLADGRWHDGPELTHPAVGGSEGLRRLRELRAKGYHIRMRLKAKGKTTRQYRLEA